MLTCNYKPKETENIMLPLLIFEIIYRIHEFNKVNARCGENFRAVSFETESEKQCRDTYIDASISFKKKTEREKGKTAEVGRAFLQTDKRT